MPDYSIDDLFGNTAPQAFGTPQFGTPVPSFNNTFEGGGGTGYELSQLKNLSIGSRTIVIKPGENIQDACNKLGAQTLGGIVLLLTGTHEINYNIIPPTGVSLVGEGIDKTIIECNGGAYGIQYTGTASVQLLNFRISELTLQNSNNAAGIDIDYCDFWRIENVRVTSCDQDGIRIDRSQNYKLIDVQSDNNTSDGFYFSNTTTRSHSIFSAINCYALSNGANGVLMEKGSSSNNIRRFTFINFTSISNTSNGFYFNASANSVDPGLSVIGGNAHTNGGDGYNSNFIDLGFFGTYSSSNTGDGYDLTNRHILMGIKTDDGNGGLSVRMTNSAMVNPSVFVGGGFRPARTSLASERINIDDMPIVSSLSDGSTRTDKKIYWMKNTSGTSLATGDVVVFKSVASGEEVTTTTTAGDNKVFGMAAEGISNNLCGNILVQGYTTKLKVDGTTDIAIGDYLSCFTTAGIAQKASAGHMVFAIALEAYTTNDSNGVIDALLISPRLI